MPKFTHLSRFALNNDRIWPHIMESEKLTSENVNKIVGAFSSYSPLLSSDADLVVFGSIARNECTFGSDVDWTLLVDGQVSDQHLDFSNLIRDVLEKGGFVSPGSSGLFGQTSYSHDLVHYIGGEDDTNRNITRRILLLLEAEKLRINNESDVFGTAYERVQKAIINEYIRHDSGFSSVDKQNARVPRFLLNDIIRFWRTMCVDFAYKQKQQDGDKWGLRNIKLRMSRKLIYLKGLLMCFSCFRKSEVNRENIAQHLFDLAQLTPLDVTVKTLEEEGLELLLLDLLDSYNSFLGSLNNETIRSTLKTLNMKNAYENGAFLAEREIANKFQDTLSKVLESNDKFRDFTKHYLIF
jgi:predicted nucleotidyltransferase